jgi:hypothetical protein
MPKPKRPNRVTLTKAQVQTEAGQELLGQALAITDDGLVSAGEVTKLRRWLHRNTALNVPAVAFLNDVVDQLRADQKKGDSWPRRRLHRALERVLPKALRSEAKGRRQEAESLAFNWSPRPVPRSMVPVMRPGAHTLLLPLPGVPLERLKAAVAERLAAGSVRKADVLIDLSGPPLPSSASPSQPRALARIVPPAEVVLRSRYCGAMLWFDECAWAAFVDPQDPDCRYAQRVP